MRRVVLHARRIADDTEAEERNVVQIAGLRNGSGLHIDSQSSRETAFDGIQLCAVGDKPVAGTYQSAMNTAFQSSLVQRQSMFQKRGAPLVHCRQSLHLTVLVTVAAPYIVVHQRVARHYIRHLETSVDAARHTGTHNAVRGKTAYQLRGSHRRAYFADAALRKNYYSQVQLVFQNAAAAFHPRKSIGSSIMLPMLNYGCTKAAAQERSIALLLAAGLTPQHAEKFPHQLSGGECQRAAIARAISIKPRLLICDEITSALDVQTQAEIIQLLLKLQAETKMSLLFISHDITLVQEICQRILIMQSGTIIESGPALDIITRPQQHYTRELVTAAFNLTKI